MLIATALQVFVQEFRSNRVHQKSETAGSFLTRLSGFTFSFGLVVHAAHAARWHWWSLFLFRNFRDQCFGGEQQTSDRRRVL
jgi:hypothetical protein